MTSQNQEDNEIKVPIFCEWTFERNLELLEGSSLYKHLLNLVKADTYNDMLTTPEYFLPGFPGIKYYLSTHIADDSPEERLNLQFHIETFYNKYNFDADFMCFITDTEPKHFVHRFGDTIDDDFFKCFITYTCSNECVGCSICADKKFVFRIEGTVIIKHADGGLWHFPIEVPNNEAKKLLREKDDTKDFVIKTKEQEIRVHKSVLIEHSTVFARMFDCDNWKETMENKIVIPDFPYKFVKYAIRACYHGIFCNNLSTKEEHLMMFQFLDKYDMEKFTKDFKERIFFTPFNVVEFANFFFQNHVIELVNCGIDYILLCSQYTLPIKDIETLDARIRAMFFDRILVSPVLKKDPKAEHRSCIYEQKERSQ